MKPSIYEDEMYKFLTEEDNFIYAHELSEKLPQIRERLLSEFWNLVESEVIESMPKGFVFGKDENLFQQWGRFWLHYPKEDRVHFCYSEMTRNMGVGIWLNKAILTPEQFTQMLKLKEGNKALQPWNQHDWWFITKPHYNFFDFNTLIKVLPHKREPLAEEMAKFLVTLAEEHRQVYEDLIREADSN